MWSSCPNPLGLCSTWFEQGWYRFYKDIDMDDLKKKKNPQIQKGNTTNLLFIYLEGAGLSKQVHPKDFF